MPQPTKKKTNEKDRHTPANLTQKLKGCLAIIKIQDILFFVQTVKPCVGPIYLRENLCRLFEGKPWPPPKLNSFCSLTYTMQKDGVLPLFCKGSFSDKENTERVSSAV